MDNDQDDQPPVRFSAGAPPTAAYEAPAAPAAPPPGRRGVSPAVVVAIAAVVLVVGLGGGYLAFHKSGSGTAPTLQSWSSGGGKERLTELSTDISAMTTAAAARDSDGVHKACVALQAAVKSAQDYKAIPDAQAQAAWATGLAEFAQSAADCIAGTDQLDATLITQADNELGTGSESLQQVAARISQINGG